MNKLNAASLLSFAGLISACSTNPPEVPAELLIDNPSDSPKPTVTNFNAALACMDDLMLANKVSPIFIASEGIVNYTSDRSLSAGGKEMLITALSRMGNRSHGVKFVSYGSDIQNMLTLQGAHPNNKEFRVPDFFIRGGITQFNKSLWSGQRGAGASVEIESPNVLDRGTYFTLLGQEDGTGSFSSSSSYGTVSLDLSAGNIANLQIIPGMTSANTLALLNKKGKAINADLTLGDLGYSYSLSGSYSYDFNSIYRSLIQVGAIELVGKLQNVPYWKCLANAGEVAQRSEDLKVQYQSLLEGDSTALIKLGQQVLAKLGYYDGAVDGVTGPATKKAIQHYQKQFNLIATSQLDFETFRMMALFSPISSEDSLPWWKGYRFAKPTESAAQ